MSLAWKLAVTVVLFLIVATAAVVLIVNLLGTPPTVDFTSQSPGEPVNVTLQTVGSFGSGSHPTWVSYLVRSPQGQWVHTTNFAGAGPHPHQRDDLPVRLGKPAAQPAARPGDRDVRQRGHAQREADSGSSTPMPATASPTPSRCRPSGINVPLYGNNSQCQSLQRGAVHTEVAASMSSSSRSPARGPATTLAVLRPLRAGLPLRQRWAHVDPRLYGRLHEGGGMSDVQAAGASATPAASEKDDARERAAPLVAPDRHLGGPLRHRRPALLLPSGPAHPSRDHDQHGRGGAVRLQHPDDHGPARHPGRLDLSGLRLRDVACLARGDPNRSAAPPPAATSASRSGGS